MSIASDDDANSTESDGEYDSEHHHDLVLTTGPSNPAAVRVRTGKNPLLRFLNRPKTGPPASWRAEPGPVPVNPRIMPGLARPIGSNLRFCVFGFSIYGRI